MIPPEIVAGEAGTPLSESAAYEALATCVTPLGDNDRYF
jgi:hypothetical protein